MFYCIGYNEGISPFIKDLFVRLKSFKVDRDFFENIKEKKIRLLENSKKAEPYQRADDILASCMLKFDKDEDEILMTLRQEFTYEKFNEMKGEWLQKLKNEWFIMGHLTEEEAKSIFEVGEATLGYTPVHKDELPE